MQYLFLILLWTVYCFLHSFLISTVFTNFLSRILGKYTAFYRLFYVAISLLLLILLINYTSRQDHTVIIPNSSSVQIIRYSLTIFSLMLFFRAFLFNYDPLSFFGIRQILNYRKSSGMEHSMKISKKGLLAIIRHPMYFALLVYLWSQVYTDVDLMINALLTIYIIIGTRLEENKLIIEFGEEYKHYQQEVPMLFPQIKRKNMYKQNQKTSY